MHTLACWTLKQFLRSILLGVNILVVAARIWNWITLELYDPCIKLCVIILSCWFITSNIRLNELNCMRNVPLGIYENRINMVKMGWNETSVPHASTSISVMLAACILPALHFWTRNTKVGLNARWMHAKLVRQFMKWSERSRYRFIRLWRIMIANGGWRMQLVIYKAFC